MNSRKTIKRGYVLFFSCFIDEDFQTNFFVRPKIISQPAAGDRYTENRHSHVSYLYNHTELSIQQIAQRIGDTVDVVLATYAHIFQARPGEYNSQIKAAKDKIQEDTLRKDTTDQNN